MNGKPIYIKWDRFEDLPKKRLDELTLGIIQTYMDTRWNPNEREFRRNPDTVEGRLYSQALCDLARKAGLNQTQIGRRANLHPVYVGLLLSGWISASRIHPGTTAKLARAFGLAEHDWPASICP
ncbi:MAG: hypothetical protein AAB599_03655 [Patescibacteria group bacterium]